jgi:LDH2 family malate/lactate/ureidoglycolate dehydrogenase
MKVSFEALKAEFKRVLLARNVSESIADECADLFASTTETGVYSHGVNRFPRFIQQLEQGDINPAAYPERLLALGAMEQWDANKGIGNLTKDPATVEQNRRILPMGYWKGSGLSIVLDMIATLLSGGLSVAEVTETQTDETCVSQIFIAIDVNKMVDGKTRDEKLKTIIDYVRGGIPQDPNNPIRLPGHEFKQYKLDNQRDGIPVDDSVWARIKAL